MPAAVSRRKLDFRNGSDVIAEVERLKASGYDRLGKWNLSQICDHLGKTTEAGLRPKGKRMPWILRKLFGEPMTRSTLKNRGMKAGGMTAKFLLPDTKVVDEQPEMIDRYLNLVREADAFPGPLPPYILCDIELEDWKQLQWIHAAHHLGFLIPKA